MFFLKKLDFFSEGCTLMRTNITKGIKMEMCIVGEGDPFVLVKLKKGETVQCESNAMVAMDAALELKGKMSGGFFAAVSRKMLNDESFFTQEISAPIMDGEVLLASELIGDAQVLTVGEKQYCLSDGAFIAASSTIGFRNKTQNIGKALIGGTGGFFIMETTGYGSIAISGFGTIFELNIEPNSPMIIDNYHIVAWDSTLKYSMSISTQKSGFLKNLVNSMTSGEGLVTRFEGRGTVYVCSRNRGSFINWIASSHGHAQ